MISATENASYSSREESKLTDTGSPTLECSSLKTQSGMHIQSSSFFSSRCSTCTNTSLFQSGKSNQLSSKSLSTKLLNFLWYRMLLLMLKYVQASVTLTIRSFFLYNSQTSFCYEGVSMLKKEKGIVMPVLQLASQPLTYNDFENILLMKFFLKTYFVIEVSCFYLRSVTSGF